MITRLGYCDKCSKAHRPKTNRVFLVFGDHSQTFFGMISLHSTLKGMTPHIYEFQRLTGNTVYFSKICCMVGCGTKITTIDGNEFVYTDDTKWEDSYMSLSNWNALCTFKDTGFKI